LVIKFPKNDNDINQKVIFVVVHDTTIDDVLQRKVLEMENLNNFLRLALFIIKTKINDS